MICRSEFPQANDENIQPLKRELNSILKEMKVLL